MKLAEKSPALLALEELRTKARAAEKANEEVRRQVQVCLDHGVPKTQIARALGITEAGLRLRLKRAKR